MLTQNEMQQLSHRLIEYKVRLREEIKNNSFPGKETFEKRLENVDNLLNRLNEEIAQSVQSEFFDKQ